MFTLVASSPHHGMTPIVFGFAIYFSIKFFVNLVQFVDPTSNYDEKGAKYLSRWMIAVIAVLWAVFFDLVH